MEILKRSRRTPTARPSRLAIDQLHPPTCPPGHVIAPPDFIGVGAQKAGTTWWFRLIEAHPKVHAIPNQRPELHFFDRFVDGWPDAGDIERYHRFFPRPPGALAGEKTPNYMACSWVPSMLRDAAPDARLISLLRDPIARYVSGRTHDEQRSGRPPAETRDPADEIRWVGDAFAKGLYAQQLDWLYACFPRERLLVLQYESCVRDPAAELARTYEFLGLPPHRPPDEELTRPRNITQAEKIQLDPRRHHLLVELYSADVHRLATMVPGLDLALWPDFSGSR